jgi:hypothetical protein
MEFAISLRSDHPSADRVRTLWRDVERFEEEPSMALLGYPPHITLARYDVGPVTEAEARVALDRASRNLSELSRGFLCDSIPARSAGYLRCSRVHQLPSHCDHRIAKVVVTAVMIAADVLMLRRMRRSL